MSTTFTSLIQSGNVAVVTGASSGIGRAACLEFSKAGMDCWMVDVDTDQLALAVAAVSDAAAADATVTAVPLDVSDAKGLESLAQDVFAAGKGCSILMNNAGIGLGGGAFTNLDTLQKVVNVNTYGPINGCLAFGPRMKEQGKPGFIINTGSKQGITMPPGNLSYNLSKAALKCYTEGLEHELRTERSQGQHDIRAALLVPGWVNTNILLKSERAKAAEEGKEYDPSTAFFSEDRPQSGAWMPTQIVDFLKEELDKGNFYVICPDNDVDRETDNLRMTWTMGDLVNDRPPLSRWHPDYKDAFQTFLEEQKKK